MEVILLMVAVIPRKMYHLIYKRKKEGLKDEHVECLYVD